MESLAVAAGIGGVGLRTRPMLTRQRATARCGALRPRRPNPPSSDDVPELDERDRMELKFGGLIGEDPKLTLAKIMARKEDPYVSYLDVEKSFAKNKKAFDHLDQLLNDFTGIFVEMQTSILAEDQRYKSQSQMQNVSSGTEGRLNLMRPVMNQALKNSIPQEEKPIVETKSSQPNQRDNQKILTKEKLNLLRPVMNNALREATKYQKVISVDSKSGELLGNTSNGSNSSKMTLRKPSLNLGMSDYLKPKVKPNLILKMRGDTDEKLSNVHLLKRPEVIKIRPDPSETSAPDDSLAAKSDKQEHDVEFSSVAIPGNEEINNDMLMAVSEEQSYNFAENFVLVSQIEGAEESTGSDSNRSTVSTELIVGSQRNEQSPSKANNFGTAEDDESVGCNSITTPEAFLLSKPQRIESTDNTKNDEEYSEEMTMHEHDEEYSNGPKVSSKPEAGNDVDDNDWQNLQHLLRTGERVEVEFISYSAKGFLALYGSLVGFLPYRNLSPKWKFFAFESWLRRKGLDPSSYRQNLGIARNFVVRLEISESASPVVNVDQQPSSNVAFEELLQEYDREKIKYLSSFIGQKVNVSIAFADRSSKRIIFSGRQKENADLVLKKRNLMGKLNVGDIVKCCIKKFTYFGVFVEVEGVPALIHQTEMTWDVTSDPSTFLKTGQIVDAKVKQLDFTNERISLSLKDVTPDPLMGTLESVFDNYRSATMLRTLEAVQGNEEWAEVETLIEELQKIEKISGVSKGRYFLSPGLAPSFQVYMASIFNSKYKLLVRHEYKVQELLVDSSLDVEEMKAVILACTNQVN